MNRGNLNLNGIGKSGMGSSHSLLLTTPCRLHPTRSVSSLVQPEKERSSPVLATDPANEKLTTQPVRSHYTSNSHFFPNAICFITAPPNFLLFIYKVTFLSFVLWTCL